MRTLSLVYVHQYVLHALDEILSVSGGAMLGGTEGLDIRNLAEGYIVEAVLKAHKDAPSYLLDGIKGDEESFKTDIHADGSVTISMLEDSARLVSIKASDSPFVVVDYATEESPIGRMQKNQYVRGTYDDPRLIIKTMWEDERKPEYVYYSIKDSSATFDLEYIPYPEIIDNSVLISDKMEFMVLNLLVSMVLDSLSYHEKAALYKKKYQEYLQTSR